MIERPSVNKPSGMQPQSWDSLMSRLEQLQGLRKETSLWKDTLDLKIDTGTFPYFLLHPLSDMHIGAVGTDSKAVRQHLQLLKDLPIYTFLLGDLGDFFNPIKHAEGMMGDVITPDDQLLMLRQFFTEYQDSILGTVQDPSHTDWIRAVSGIEPQRWLVQDLQIPMVKSGGRVNLNVNGIDYKLLLFHKIGRFNSALNITNAGKRMLDMHDNADIVVSGHTHIGAVEKVVKRDGKPIILNLGTFKTKDEYGERGGMVPRPQVFFPTLFFDARRKNIEVIEDPDAARDLVNGMGDFIKKKSIAMLGLPRTLDEARDIDPD